MVCDVVCLDCYCDMFEYVNLVVYVLAFADELV